MKHNVFSSIVASALLIGTVTFAGAVGGEKYAHSTLNGYEKHDYRVVFEAKKTALVLVVGDKSSDIDCYVFDNAGNLVTSDTDRTDQCALVWVPAWKGKFRIVVRNMGKEPNEYSMATN
jgi:hypothetical protein